MILNNSESSNEITVSLILATQGRLSEVIDFCESLNSQNYELDKVELIVVDQNETFYLRNFFLGFTPKYKILYIRSPVKGLSFSRNLGIELARGRIIGYPDDDCTYYPDTLKEVIRCFGENSQKKIIFGRIFDRGLGRNVIRAWPVVTRRVGFANYFRYSNSVTMFHSQDPLLRFDNEMGAGQYFGSCEDVDFLYRWLENNQNVEYYPSIDVWHPDFDPENVTLDKVRSYARGFGFFMQKKHSVRWPKYLHFILLIFYKTFQMQRSIFRKTFKKGYFSAYFYGIFEGIFSARK